MKYVPNAQSKCRFEDSRSVRGEDDVLNESGENAVEAAVQLIEEHGGEVTALTADPEDTEDALVRALQMGADRDVPVTDERLAGAGAGLTTLALAVATQKINGDGEINLIVTGTAFLDPVTPMLPAVLATRLRIPLLGLAHSIEVDPGSDRAMIRCTVDDYDDELAAAMPLVVSIIDQINEPRCSVFAAMKAARKKPMDQVELAELASTPASALIEERPRVIEILETDEVARESTGAIIPDSGDAGACLATYLLEVAK